MEEEAVENLQSKYVAFDLEEDEFVGEIHEQQTTSFDNLYAIAAESNDEFDGDAFKSLENVMEFISADEEDLMLMRRELRDEEDIESDIEDGENYEEANEEEEYLQIVEFDGHEIYYEMYQFTNEIVDEALLLADKESIIETIRSADLVTQSVLSDLLRECLASEEHLATETVEDVLEMHAVRSGTVVARDIIDTVISRCLSMNRMAKEFICDLVQRFPSPMAICKGIAEEILMNALYAEKPAEVRLTLQLETFEDKECLEYSNVFNIADTLLGTLTIRGREDILSEIRAVRPKNLQSKEQVTDKFPWPTIQSFTIDKGLQSVITYVRTWECKENWLFDVEYLMAQSNECSDYYLYEAKFGIPTYEYPIPQVTASVFFTIEVSRVLPKGCPVVVTYAFESNRVVHSAMSNNFHENWLFNVVEAKLDLFKRVAF